MSENSLPNTFLVFLTGIAAGAALGVLLAPCSGEETRQRLGDMGKKAGDRARDGADQATGFVRDQAKRFEHAFEEGKRAFKEGSNG